MTETKKKEPRVVARKSTNISSKSKKKKINWLNIIVVIIITISLVLLIVIPVTNRKPVKNTSKSNIPKFKKEGVLTFIKDSTRSKIRTIDIEIAENDYERALGLMYRAYMDDSKGMLFIMEREEPQSFWMRNTYISLDIIYLDKELKIVKIQKYTEPLSEVSVPSVNNSKYVVEVVAGFCDKYIIEEGDTIIYKRDN